MRGTAPSSHWPISAPHAPTHQFASTKPLTKHTLHTYLNARHKTHKTHGIVIYIQQPYSTLSFTFSNHIVLCHSTRPMDQSHSHNFIIHKAIPSLWSSRAPMMCPSQRHIPMACPLKSNPSPRSSRMPPWRINPITLIQSVLCAPMASPLNQSHHPFQPVPHTWFNPIAPIQPVTWVPMACPHISILSPWSSRVPSWHIPDRIGDGAVLLITGLHSPDCWLIDR